MTKALYIRFTILASLFSLASPMSSQADTTEHVITLNEFNERVANKQKAVLVYFSADWCRICFKMKPVIAEAEQMFTSQMDVVRIDTERDKEVAEVFEVNSIGLPLLMLYCGGREVWTWVGLLDSNSLQKELRLRL
jgi:thioredoxin-like negative regulator of GroEL